MDYLDLNGNVNRRVFIKGLGVVSVGLMAWKAPSVTH